MAVQDALRMRRSVLLSGGEGKTHTTYSNSLNKGTPGQCFLLGGYLS